MEALRCFEVFSWATLLVSCPEVVRGSVSVLRPLAAPQARNARAIGAMQLDDINRYNITRISLFMEIYPYHP